MVHHIVIINSSFFSHFFLKIKIEINHQDHEPYDYFKKSFFVSGKEYFSHKFFFVYSFFILSLCEVYIRCKKMELYEKLSGLTKKLHLL